MSSSRELPVRARRLLPAFLIVLTAATIYRMAPASPDAGAPSAGRDAPRRVLLSGDTMGTTYNVTLAPGADAAAMRRLVERELSAVDASMSTYRADSELSRLNRAGAGAALAVSTPLRQVLEVALDVGKRSGGALDVTIGPLVDAWGFGPADAAAGPDEAALQALRPLYGEGALSLDEAGVIKRAAGVRCDLSAVAKGFAVDRVAEALKAAGQVSYLVEVGGEVMGVGERPGGGPWRLGVERPVEGRREVMRAIPLRDMGMATSGDYRNFRTVGGQRVSHIMDPRSGRPATTTLASVTVLHRQVARADAWATALTVLGPQQGLAMAEREGLAVLFVVRGGADALRTVESQAFTRYLKDSEP